MVEWFLITREQLERRLRGFAYVRAGLVTSVLAMCSALERDRVFLLEVRPWYLHLVFVAAYMLCLVQLIGVRRRAYRSDVLIGLHIFFDICVVTGIVHFTGSLGSPFTLFYVVVILSASVLLTQTATLLSAMFSTLAMAGTAISTHKGWLESQSALAAFSRSMSNIPEVEFWSQLGMLVLSFHVSAFLGGYLSRSLRIQREIQDDLFQSLRTGLVAFDRRGRISFMNKAAERILGKNAEEVLGDPVETLLPEGMETLLKSCYEKGQEVQDEEVVLDTSDSRDLARTLEISTSSSRGKHSRHLALIDDVTRIRELEKRIRIQEKLAIVGEAAAGVAHEIRNPLASIRSAATSLRKDIQAQGHDARLVELIVRESDRLGKVVTTFLEYARISFPVSRTVSLNAFLREFEGRWKQRGMCRTQDGPAQDLHLEMELPQEEFLVRLDRDQMIMVLENLISNAVQAGAGRVRVRVEGGGDSMLQGSRKVRVLIQDDGCGILDRAKARLFEPFFTTRTQGTGMGLAIVDRIVAAHGGRVIAKNHPEGGALFSLILDREEQEAEDA